MRETGKRRMVEDGSRIFHPKLAFGWKIYPALSPPPWEVSQSPFRGSLVQLRAGSFQRPGFQHHSHTSGNQGWILRPLTRFGDPGPDFETPLTLWAPGAEFSNPSHTLGARGWIWRPLPHFGHPGPDFETPPTLWAPSLRGQISGFFPKSPKS